MRVMGPTDDLRDAIRRARKLRGMTQQELADAVDVHLRSVSNWEAGKARPGEATMRKLAEVLNVPTPTQHDGPMHEGTGQLKANPDVLDKLRRVSRELGYVRELVDDLVIELSPPTFPTTD